MSKSLKILPLKDKEQKNSKWKDIEHIISAPFTMCIHAPSRSGKSVVITNLIYNEAFNFKERFNKIIFISPTILIDSTLEYAREDDDIVKIHDEDMLENLDLVINNILATQKEGFDKEGSAPPTLLILDDCLAYLKNKTLSYLSTKNRHYAVSLILTSQYYRKIDPVIRANATNWILFKTMVDKEKEAVIEDLNAFPNFDGFYEEATKEPYSFLFADMLKMRLFKRFEGEPLYDKMRDWEKY
jgi:hypothetical protein